MGAVDQAVNRLVAGSNPARGAWLVGFLFVRFSVVTTGLGRQRATLAAFFLFQVWVVAVADEFFIVVYDCLFHGEKVWEVRLMHKCLDGYGSCVIVFYGGPHCHSVVAGCAVREKAVGVPTVCGGCYL